MTDIIRELREDYPPVDVTTVVFSRDFAGVGCCVIPQDKVLAVADTIDALVAELQRLYEKYGHQATADVLRVVGNMNKTEGRP